MTRGCLPWTGWVNALQIMPSKRVFLNIFEKVSAKIRDGSSENLKIIDIAVDEKATGEISLGAGAGTSGTTIGFAVKENNFLGKGINFTNSLSISDETIRGQFKVSNPNYKNSDNCIHTVICES